MKNFYNEPEFEIVKLPEDIITTSPDPDDKDYELPGIQL